MTAEIVILNWNGRDHLRTFLPSVVAAAPAGVGVVSFTHPRAHETAPDP